MTVADATPDIEHLRQEDRAFLGHPKGLGFLGFTEACERFSYYSMQTLLVLYMVNYLLLPGRMENVVGLTWMQTHVYHGISGQPLASAIFGTYTSLVYGTPIIGGIIADKWLGRDKTLIVGGVLMAIGHFLMAIRRSCLPYFACCSGSARSRETSQRRSARSTAPTTSDARWRSRSSTSSSMSA
jgi:POT family proton-dependent oligopeptide transporter